MCKIILASDPLEIDLFLGIGCKRSSRANIMRFSRRTELSDVEDCFFIGSRQSGTFGGGFGTTPESPENSGAAWTIWLRVSC